MNPKKTPVCRTKGKENCEPNAPTGVKRAKSPNTSKLNKKQKQETCDDDKIKVYLRLRPLINDEEPMDIDLDKTTITIRPPQTKNSSYFCVDKSFTFRSVLNSHAKQETVYETAVEPLIDDFLNGNDVLVFCYGSTNAGKTYTVTGPEDDPGILYRALNRVVPDLLTRSPETTKLYASYNEIYNERIYDLLADKKESLQIGINIIGDTEVKGCTEIPITCVDDIKYVVQKGIEGRHRGSTELNVDSSRSHSIFRLKYVNNMSYSWLSIVDLAGSERLSIMNSTCGSFKEACNINKSMLVLGRCIRCLKEQGITGQKIPIPYRESKLTHIFKNLFEPTKRQARAAMIINISPSITQIEDTIFSLQFAAEASECSIRQVSRPQDINQDYNKFQIKCQPDELLIEDKSPQIVERKLKVALKKEMEEALLQRKMQYEHQIQELISFQNMLKQPKDKNEDINAAISSKELQPYKEELEKINKENEELKNELSMCEEQLKNEESAKEKISKENKSLEDEITALKKLLTELSSSV